MSGSRAEVTRAVVLAGGRGARLKPFTMAYPKPLVPVGDAPIVDVIVRQLRAAGISRITMAVGHLAELVMAYFETRNYEGLTIDYSREAEPLGTAGPLALIDDLDERFLVVNGDILTSLNFGGMIADHCSSGSVATIAAFRKEVRLDLGVLEVSPSNELLGYREKPTSYFDVSMGAYVFEPNVHSFIPAGERYDLPDLIIRLQQEAGPVHVHRFDGFWLDIGRPDDYARAVDEFDSLEPLLFPAAG